MAYIVKEVKNISFKSARNLFEHPVANDENGFTNTLASLPPSHGSGFAAFGDYRQQHRVVLMQSSGSTSHAFALYHGEQELATDEALQTLHELLLPFMREGNVLLTERLLQAMVLPKPKTMKQLLHDLVHVMEKQPESHPQWYKVVQAMLHPACYGNDYDGVKTLLRKGGELCKANQEGNTPLHTAASGVSSEGMEWLLQLAESQVQPRELTRTLQRRNSKGCNVADVASSCENKFVMNVTLKKIACLGMSVGIAGGSSALHDAATRDDSDVIWTVIRQRSIIKTPATKRPALVQLPSLFLDPADQNGLTPLMLAVRNGFVSSAASLLHGGVDPNFRNPVTGSTALHYAAESSNITLIRMLCAFDADASIADESGKIPVDIVRRSSSKAAKECTTALCEFAELQSKARAFYEASKSDPLPVVKPGTVFLLSLDGGGMKSLNTGQIVIAIEKRMKQLQPNCGSFASYFDFIAGTSAGGVATLLLGHMAAPLTLARALVMRYFTSIITKPLVRREKLTRDFFKEVFGSESTLDEVSKPKTMLMCTLADQSPPELHMMCNYGGSRNGQKAPSERKLWEAACATGAAPAHFPAFDGKFLDGGIMANNPTLDALVEIFEEGKKLDRPVELGCVLSIGSGYGPPKPVDNIDFFIPSATSAVTKLRENISSLVNLLNLLIAQVTRSDGSEVKRAQTWCELLGVPYFRFSPPLHDNIGPTVTDMNVMCKMLFNTEKYVLESSQQIDRIAKLLLARKSSESLPIDTE